MGKKEDAIKIEQASLKLLSNRLIFITFLAFISKFLCHGVKLEI